MPPHSLFAQLINGMDLRGIIHRDEAAPLSPFPITSSLRGGTGCACVTPGSPSLQPQASDWD